MCLGVPGQIVGLFREHDLAMARVDFGGTVRRVCVEHTPEAGVGDYVIVHVGFALSRVDEAEARALLGFLAHGGHLDELGPADAAPDLQAADPAAPAVSEP